MNDSINACFIESMRCLPRGVADADRGVSLLWERDRKGETGGKGWDKKRTTTMSTKQTGYAASKLSPVLKEHFRTTRRRMRPLQKLVLFVVDGASGEGGDVRGGGGGGSGSVSVRVVGVDVVRVVQPGVKHMSR